MNNIILSTENTTAIDPSNFRILDSNIIHHLKTILNVGESNQCILKIIIPNVGIGSGRFYLDKNGCFCVEVLEIQQTKGRKIHLGVATTRPPMAKRILEHATTLGAASFNFFPAELSEKSYTSSKIYTQDQAKVHIQKGMAQCSQYFTEPQLILFKNLENILVEFKNRNIPIYWLDIDAPNFFTDSIINQEILLLIGPERGWTKQEVEFLNGHEIIGIKLSNSVMRVEFAVNAAFAQIEYISNRGSNV